MPNYSGGPFRRRTWWRSHLPWFLINLGIASKGKDCEAVGGQHEFYNINEEVSGCYHCEITFSGKPWNISNKESNKLKLDKNSEISEILYEFNDIGFTEIEKKLIEDPFRYTTLFYISAHLVYILPCVFIAIYGILKKDYIAISIGFIAIVLYIIYSITNTVKYRPIFKSILIKYHSYIERMEIKR